MSSTTGTDITISLCGDIFISKRIPSKPYQGYDDINNLLSQHECIFANLETTIHCQEGYPEVFPGGGYAMADPTCLYDLKKMGFNLFNTANNHAMDYGHNGLLATIKYLDKYEIPFAGTGKNLADASRPAYFESSNGRIGLISVTSSFHDSYAAGSQNQDMQGRPGVSPLRHKAVYELDADNYNAISKIAHDTGINNYHNQAINEGYLLASENFKFGSYEFKKGMENQVHTTPNITDMQRTINQIMDAKYKSEVIIVSVHSHQFGNNDKESSPEFIEIFTRNCINAGADIVVCHGPHILRGVEHYKSGIIFHGLGNFIFQHEQMDCLPEEFYNKYGKKRDTVTGISEILNVRSRNGTVGLSTSPSVWRSIIVSLTCNERTMEIKLYPIELINRSSKGLKGLPVLSADTSILEDVNEMSAKYNTVIDIKHDCGYIKIKR